MRPDEHETHNNSQPPSRRRNFALFFFERIGERTYLRLTPLAVVLVIVITVAALVSLLAIYLVGTRRISSEPVNVNVNVRPAPASTPRSPVIRQAPPQSPAPKVIIQPRQITPMPGKNENVNRQSSPTRTPDDSPPKPPT